MKKILALATTLTLLLTISVPVLADDNTAKAAPSQAESHQSSLADRTIKAQERLENKADKLENKQQIQQDLEPIRALQKQEVQIRQQIHSLRNQIKQQVKTDRQAKNYTALTAALNDMIPMQDDITNVTAAAKTCLTDWQQYYSDRQAKNSAAITTDLQKLQSDIQTKITAMQKVLTDLQKISQDLNTQTASPSPSAPAENSSSTTSDQTTDSVM